MFLNTLSPADGSRKERRRVGRGQGSGLGKMGGRGHKGQKSRSGGFHKVGFEGGQMPIQRRLPKVGFSSHMAKFSAEVRLDALNVFAGTEIDVALLKAHDLVPANTKKVKIVKSGDLTASVTLSGINVTAGAKEAILAAGGTIKE
ncbi:50S ribosomal protein L15 [Thiomicrospira microaerophila]|uniref:50S ribosomal protein L15 n=1 Tax=Thiomicrospira microaerophila TaxID=406020 RepID=UPI00200CCB00|nr:50S ribosomal protein L15 [Thiomicrospira microaerophila]UQB41991.1 50S ribosomal protein L15 [Thiomicrospira microaerophila]